MFQSRHFHSFSAIAVRRRMQFACKSVATGLLLGSLVACGGSSSGVTGTGDGTGGSGGTDTDPVTRIGNGFGASFVNGEIGIQSASIQAGASTQLQITIVNANGDAVTDPITVTVNSECLASGLSTLDGATDTTTGAVTLDYAAAGCSGEDALTATATALSGETVTAIGSITIEPDQVLSVQFIDAEPLSLSLRGVGGEETSRVSFQMVGQQSAPIVGETVNFTLSTEVGGLSLAEDSAVSDDMGMVTAIVQSGTVHTTVVVTATHEATDVSGSSAGINISTGVPQASKLTLSVDNFAPRAFNFNGTEVNFSIIAADQFGNPVPDNTVISFASPESGTITPSCTTLDARCSVTWISSDPRPSDGRATIIAFTSGAEDFTDTNGNSIFDGADVFDVATMDLDEPFIDENENGLYDLGEFFHDFNSNGTHDVGDMQWNGPLCEHSSDCGTADEVGIFEVATLALSTDAVKIFDYGSFPSNASPGFWGTINVEWGAVTNLRDLMMSDTNDNSMVAGTSIDFATNVGALGGTTNFEVGVDTTRPNGPYAVSLEMDGENEDGVLTMTVDVPGVFPQEFLWEIQTSCTGPDGATGSNVDFDGATVTTTANPNTQSTAYIYEFGPAGFVPGSGTEVEGGLVARITGLEELTAYDVYVSTDCGGTASAIVAGPVNFTTPAAPPP